MSQNTLANGRNVVWFDLTRMQAIVTDEAAAVLDVKIAQVRGPQWPEQPAHGQVPIVFNEDDIPGDLLRAWEASGDRPAYFDAHWEAPWLRGEIDFLVPADCSSCQHHWHPGCYPGDPEIGSCIYPFSPGDFVPESENTMLYDAENCGYRSAFFGSRYDVVHREWLKEDLLRRLDGVLWRRIGKDRVTRITDCTWIETTLCPAYAPNLADEDLFVDILNTGISVDGIFGIRSLAEAQRQAEYRRLAELTEILRNRWEAAMSNHDSAKVVGARITKLNIDSQKCHAFVEHAASLIRSEECRNIPRLRTALSACLGSNISRGAKPVLIEKIIERCHRDKTPPPPSEGS